MFNKKKDATNRVRQTRIPAQRIENKEFFSYHASRNNQTSESIRARQNTDERAKKRSIVQYAPIAFAVLCLVIGLVFATTLQSNVVLKSGEKSALLRDESQYREIAQSYLKSSILNQNKFSIDVKSFENAIKQEFPELNDVSVTIPVFGQKPIVTVSTETPELLIDTKQGIYAVNDSGKVIAKASKEQPIEGLTIPTIRDDANLEFELGKGALTSQDVAFITTIIKQFSNKKIEIDSLTLPVLAAELHVRVKDEPYYIKFNMLTDPRVVSGQYFAAKKKFDADNIKPKEYVDSRVEEKIFFR